MSAIVSISGIYRRSALQGDAHVDDEPVLLTHGHVLFRQACSGRGTATAGGRQHLPGWLMNTRLAYGYALLLLGSADDTRSLGQPRDLIFLDEQTFPPVGKGKAWIILSHCGPAPDGGLSN